MLDTMNDQKRIAIGIKLAEMQETQKLLIDNNKLFLSVCSDEDICERLGEMLKDDQKNLKIIDTVIVQYGVPTAPGKPLERAIAATRQLMNGSELTLYEKVLQHELLKHKQVMNGLVLHKAAQVVGADIEAAIAPLNAVNFENRAHQEQLKGILEILGVRDLTGREAKQGIWARVQDAIAALTGVVGSAASHAPLETRVQDLIRMDHHKVNMLFKQIEQSQEPKQIQEFFGQLYKDLLAHAAAEEQVVYPIVRSFYGETNTRELYDEQAEMKQALDRIKSLSPAAPEFKAELRRLKQVVLEHVHQEEHSMFVAMRDNLSEKQDEKLAIQFRAVKGKLQEQLTSRR